MGPGLSKALVGFADFFYRNKCNVDIYNTPKSTSESEAKDAYPSYLSTFLGKNSVFNFQGRMSSIVTKYTIENIVKWKLGRKSLTGMGSSRTENLWPWP